MSQEYYCHACCKTVELEPSDEDDDDSPPEMSCPDCGGSFLEIVDYQERHARERHEAIRRRVAARPPGPGMLHSLTGGAAEAGAPASSMAELTVHLEMLRQILHDARQARAEGAAGGGASQPGFDGLLENMFSSLGRPSAYADEGQAAAGTPQSVIDALPSVAFDQTTAAGEPCPICHDTFDCSKKGTRLPCNHVFHTDCVTTWLQLHPTCPVCRRNVVESPP